MIVDALNLESLVPPVRRKAPNLATLEEAVKNDHALVCLMLLISLTLLKY